MQDTSLVDIAIGNKVRLLRMAKKLSSEDLAARIGLSEIDYINHEAGELRFSPEILMKLCRILQVGLAEIFTDLV